MSGVGFRPSEVLLRESMPLCDTFDRAENELAAAILVFALRAGDDVFRPIAVRDARKAAAIHPRPFGLSQSLITPGFRALVVGGWARVTHQSGQATIEFTEKGLERLKIWVPKRAEVSR